MKTDGRKLADMSEIEFEKNYIINSRLHLKKIINGRCYLQPAVAEIKTLSQRYPEVMEARIITLDDDENPFQRGSLLENIRESTDNYILEAMNDPTYTEIDKPSVAKKLDFPKPQIPISKDPKFIPSSKDRQPVVRQEIRGGGSKSPVDHLEARHQEKLSKYQQMIAEEKAAIRKEAPKQTPADNFGVRGNDPRPGQGAGGLSSYYNKLTEEVKLDRDQKKTPQKVLRLIRLDDRVCICNAGTDARRYQSRLYGLAERSHSWQESHQHSSDAQRSRQRQTLRVHVERRSMFHARCR